MTNRLLPLLIAVLYVAAGASMIWIGPEMLTSGWPELILLAWLLPPCWLVFGLAGYIALADRAWPDPQAAMDQQEERAPDHEGVAMTATPLPAFA